MSASAGKFIAIEGLEGAGKSTAISAVMEYLNSFHIETITTREPGGTAIGEILRTIIKNPDYKNELTDKSELLLFYASRIQLVEQVIKPALAKGCWVIADRFEMSTFAYQGGGRGIDKDWIRHLSSFSIEGFKPDLTLYLDINPDIGMERAKSRGQFDRIELQDMDFFYRTHAAFLEQIKGQQNVSLIDASQDLAKVQQSIRQVLAGFVGKQR